MTPRTTAETDPLVDTTTAEMMRGLSNVTAQIETLEAIRTCLSQSIAQRIREAVAATLGPEAKE